jgi:hypothetical protein
MIPICPICHKKGKLNTTYDAYYCCNTWLENKCSDTECDFCNKRPDTPPKES